jgi:Predicted methyltransferase regulatory domain/Methyltransferase domain
VTPGTVAAMQAVADLYEDVRYPGFPFPQTHPDRLALLARLHGLAPPPPDECRVLEVGCADGINVLGMAASAPGLEAVGIDRAAGPLERGRELTRAAGLENVRLEALDVRDAGDALGRFDYVVAHGLYAWVPDDVRESLMALLAGCLARHGVAFVSYNARPGAGMRALLREMALMYAGETTSAQERAAGAQELYELMAPWVTERPDAYGRLLEHELGRLRRLSPAMLVHDDLSELYRPVWLRDFVAHARAHGLDYLCEAELSELEADRHPEGFDSVLDRVASGDRVEWEQYADFLAGRSFRQTLLCRAEAQPVPGELVRAIRRGDAALPDAPQRHAGAPGACPEASPLARAMARDSADLVNLRQEHVRLEDPLGRLLVRLLDGTRERPALVDAVVAAVGGELRMTMGGEPVTDGEQLRSQIAGGLEHNLHLIAGLGLLRP